MSSGFGPAFQDARSRFYRAEYAVISAVIIGYLAWWSLRFGGIEWLYIVFWFVFPDLASFVPMGLSSERRQWPSWGASLYNIFHTILVWVVVFAGAWILFGAAYWPLLGWLGHITIDRTAGYGLRASRQTIATTSV